MLVRVPDNVKEATTDSPWPDVTAIPLEFIYRWTSRPRRLQPVHRPAGSPHELTRAVTDLGEQIGG